MESQGMDPIAIVLIFVLNPSFQYHSQMLLKTVTRDQLLQENQLDYQPCKVGNCHQGREPQVYYVALTLKSFD